ncbi:adenosylcobinamide-phosphate synthase CbiB [Dyadobacter sp. CY312]|uniref:adenosylcobinamide-phosphate synthase CbiB n=1 Tax=Dyadobacter sp. CY312 TaxID=2907303 RepID=UPI001F344960|nr:adenosylcobinamide-phosphate synthase CbiB [Dyadobacter sp. CY312]MCE7040846.1 adenosylcobinamide-phosphate synthase CbiB [Dyadobacter sp. CY312]
MEKAILLIAPLLIGYVLDLLIGDPDNWPHPVRVFGNLIAYFEKKLNRNSGRFMKGAVLAIALVLVVFSFFTLINLWLINLEWPFMIVNGVFVWYGLANKSLITEGKNVFLALESGGIEAGRKRLSRIVGRDTSQLTPQQIHIAVLETMSENLSDGVIAPLFFFAIGGVPGMMAYKMINTMDSMLGYRNERYEKFGKFAARLDDVANFIPSRLTAFLMVLVTFSRKGFQFIFRYGHKHKSPNAGYPEAALAGILGCRFGGPNIYHGVVVDKPFIGETDRDIKPDEIRQVISINHKVCFVMVIILVISFCCYVKIPFWILPL